MKYVCFGHLDVQNWETKSESERNALIDECFTYDDALRRNGNWVSGEGLQVGAATLRYKKGQVSVTDGPYIETKDLLGGLLILEARDLNHAIQLISNHPRDQNGPLADSSRPGP
jgi:hypothetical protein